MNKVVEKIANQLGNSEPVFVFSLSEDKQTLRGKLVDEYDPRGMFTTPIEQLVCESFSEQMNNRNFQFEKCIGTMTTRTRSSVMEYLIDFYSKNCGLKNPRQSKLFKFLKEYRNLEQEQLEGLLYVYEYVKLNQEPPHVQNALAVLDAFRRKYE